jgi:hypothetical protein
VDVLIYHLLLVQEPILLIKYIHLNRYVLNIKEARSFFSHLCKYEAYDAIKLLEFAKRTFKAIYDVERIQGDLKVLMEDVVSTPLVETKTIEQLDAGNENQAKLVKSIDKIKAKLKYKMNSSSVLRKRISMSGI